MSQLFSLTFFDTPETFIIIGLIIFISQFIYAALGFGSGMFAISLLALIYGNLPRFVPFFILLCIPTEIYVSIKDRDKIDFKHNWKFLIFIFPAMFIGTLLLKKSDNPIVLIALGCMIMALSVYYLFYETKIQMEFKSKFWFMVFGSVSGVLGALFGMAGPPLIFYFKNLKLPKGEFRVALLSIFLAMTFFRIILYSYKNLFTSQMIYSAIFLFPIAILGVIFGNIMHDKIPEITFKRATSVTLFISGFLIVLRKLIGF